MSVRKYTIPLSDFVLGVSAALDIIGGGLALDFLCVILEGLSASLTLYYIYCYKNLDMKTGYLVKFIILCLPLVFVLLIYKSSSLLAVLGSISFVLKVLGSISLKEGILEIEIIEE